MYKFLKELDEDLYQRFEDIRNAWINHNSGIYSILQSYTECLIKFLIKFQKKGSYLDNRSNLGSMLDNSYVLSVLKHDLKIDNKEFLQKINKTANTYKHDRRVEFIDTSVLENIKEILDLSKKVHEYIHNEKLSVSFDDSLFSRENPRDFLTKIATTTDDIAKSSKDLIENEIDRLEHSNNEINSQLLSLEEVGNEGTQQYISKDDLRSKIIDLIHRQDSISYDLGTNSIDYINISNELRHLRKQLYDGLFEEYQSKDIKKRVLEAVLDNNVRIEKDLNRESLKLTDTIESNKEDPIHAYSLLSELNTKSFSSNYVSEASFSILGVDEYNIGCSSIYRSYYAVLFNQLIKGDRIRHSDFLANQNLSEIELSEIYMIQVLILSMIRNGVLTDEKWEINLVNRKIGLLKVAIFDIFYRIEILIELSKSEFIRPQIKLISDQNQSSEVNISFDVYYPSKKNFYTINRKFDKSKLIKLWFENRIVYSIENNAKTQAILTELLQLLFRFDVFLPGQLPILINVLNGNSTIGILTTGGGKSLVYQFAGLMQPKITLVIDPMNALIIDQCRKLTDDFDIKRVLTIISENTNKLTANENIEIFHNDPPLFLFASPERFQNSRFRDLLISFNANQVFDLIVLDEVHCLSEWGHDFRTSYLMLIHTINIYINKVRYLGLTATAALNVVRDLQVELDIFTTADIIFSTRLQRDNLYFLITEAKDSYDMSDMLLGLLKEDHLVESPRSFNKQRVPIGSQIVFFKTKKELDKQYRKCLDHFSDEIAFFHGGFKDYQDSFMKNDKTLLFSTNSFGMGIDKPNIRKTTHFGMPSSRENFFQEAGRSGRDNKTAMCHLLTFGMPPRLETLAKSFLDLNTPLKELKNLSSSLNNEVCDFGINAFFMLNRYEDPSEEAKLAIRVYDHLCKNGKDLICQVTIQKDNYNQSQNRFEQCLYNLHKIGIVINWEIEYKDFKDIDNSKINFVVLLHKNYNDFEYIKMKALNYIKNYYQNGYYRSDIEKLNDISELEQLIKVVRDWYHSTFFRSRREQFANMVDFVKRYKNKNANTEIQNEMSKYFDISRLLQKMNTRDIINFEHDNIETVVTKILQTTEDEFDELNILMGRLLETEESTNINIFTSLINLMNNKFESRNGRERFEYAIRNLRSNERIDVYKNMESIYHEIKPHQRRQLIDVLYNEDKDVFAKELFSSGYVDELIAEYQIYRINDKYSNLFKGESE
jgi:ATP-dependent DNA helicase RecQ